MHKKIVPNSLYRDFEVTGTLQKASEHRIVFRTVLKKHEKFLSKRQLEFLITYSSNVALICHDRFKHYSFLISTINN